MSNQGKKMTIQQKHEVETTAANQHNCQLNKETAQKMKGDTLEIIDKSVIEWYFRTLGDEIYKLSFIDKNKYNRVKMFWPSQVQEEELKKNNETDIRFWFEQFNGFDIEDYFDLIIKPTLKQRENEQNIEINLKIYLNGFTMEKYTSKNKDFSTQTELVLFYKLEEQFNDIASFTNTLINKYICKDRNQNQLMLNEQELKRRFVPIIAEDTRLLLYELYRKQ